MQNASYPPGCAVVFGGSGGVGRAICARLADAGSDVVLTYRKNRAAADEVVAAIRALSRRAVAHAVGADEPDALQSLLDDAATRFDGVHTVVHAAGSDIPMRFVSEVSRAEWRDVMTADAAGFFDLVRASLPHLRKSRGSIVAITSAGLSRFPTRDILSVAPKAAIEALVRAVAKEEGRFGVRANSVALGVIEAGIFSRLSGGDLGKDWIAAARTEHPAATLRDGRRGGRRGSVPLLVARQLRHRPNAHARWRLPHLAKNSSTPRILSISPVVVLAGTATERRRVMKTVMVRYTTAEAHAETNAALIREVFEELRTSAPAGIRYASYRLDDGVSFVHVATLDGPVNPLSTLPAFKAFQKGIADRCVEPPVVTELSVVGSYGGHLT